MPPKQSSTASKAPAKAKRGRPSNASSSTATGNKRRTTASSAVISDEERASHTRTSRRQAYEEEDGDDGPEDEDDEEEQRKTIPRGLLTRLLHEFFQQEGTRITKDADAAVWKYMDTFVREAIARAGQERREGGFLEAEDVEKIIAQLILDM